MTNKEFVKSVENIFSKDTIYAKGAIATYVSLNTINSLKNQKNIASWYTSSKIKSRFEPLYGKDYYAFDCSGLIKAAIWGFEPEQKDFRCTKGYEINGIGDFPVDTVSDVEKVGIVSNDFSSVEIGEMLFTPGHVGVYVGNGLCIECTPAWDNCVQYTAVGNFGSKKGYNTRTWKYHVKLNCLTYEKGGSGTVTISLPVLKKGAKGNEVKTLQRLLASYGFKDDKGNALEIDGSFGAKTLFALKAYQKEFGLTVDGSCGLKTWTSLLRG